MTGRERGLHFNHRKWLAQRALLSERIGEAAPLPGSTPALSASLWLTTQLLETLVRNVLPLPLPGTPSAPGAAALTKSAVGWPAHYLLATIPAWSSFEGPCPFLLILTSTVLTHVSIFTLGWMAWIVSWLNVWSLPTLSSYFLLPILESSSETSVLGSFS